MTGGEIAAAALAGKMVTHAGKAIAEEGKSTKKELLEQAKSTPEFGEAARQLAKRIAIRQEIVTSCYKPIAKLFGVANHYFDNDFERDLAEKLADVPEENIVTPKASVAAPAMQGLAYSLEEPDLKELYLNLLASASDDRVSEDVHPAFVEVVRQLSAEETPYLSKFLGDGAVACVRITSKFKEETGKNGWAPILDHVLDTPTEVRRLAIFVDNWVRLGLAEVQYLVPFSDAELYGWVQAHPAFQRITAENSDPERDIAYDRGSLRATALGSKFAQAVGMTSEEE